MLYPYKCIDCVYCNESEHKCYPKSRDCKNEYDLTDEDMYQMSTARCDFYRPKKVERRDNTPDREKVIKGLERCIEHEDCGDCPYVNTCDDPFEFAEVAVCLMQDTLTLLKEQEAEIERLKRPDCEHANHDRAGCLGYCGSEQDDEPIEACKQCEKYTGNICAEY